MELTTENIEYINKIADFLLKMEQEKYIAISNLTDNSPRLIEAAKIASETYHISITFTPDYLKIKRDRTWKS